MNASSNVSNVEIANKIASTAALFRKYFPDASVNFSPWENSNNESMQDTIDFAFHFPGWSPLIECRAILLQLRIENDNNGSCLLYTSPSPRDTLLSRMPSSA